MNLYLYQLCSHNPQKNKQKKRKSPPHPPTNTLAILSDEEYGSSESHPIQHMQVKKIYDYNHFYSLHLNAKEYIPIKVHVEIPGSALWHTGHNKSDRHKEKIASRKVRVKIGVSKRSRSSCGGTSPTFQFLVLPMASIPGPFIQRYPKTP